MDPHRNGKAGRPKKSERNNAAISPINPSDYLPELNSAGGGPGRLQLRWPRR